MRKWERSSKRNRRMLYKNKKRKVIPLANLTVKKDNLILTQRKISVWQI